MAALTGHYRQFSDWPGRARCALLKCPLARGHYRQFFDWPPALNESAFKLAFIRLTFNEGGGLSWSETPWSKVPFVSAPARESGAQDASG